MQEVFAKGYAKMQEWLIEKVNSDEKLNSGMHY
jgi:hypothetical protein